MKEERSVELRSSVISVFRKRQRAIVGLAGSMLLAAACDKTPEVPALVDAHGLRVETGTLEPQVNLFTWPDYMDPELLREFEATYGVRVVVDYYDTNEALLAKLDAGGSREYDVIVASDYAVDALIGDQALAAMDSAAVPNLRNLAPRFRRPPYDPDGRFTAAYQWGTSGLGVRTDRIDGPLPDSWAVVFDSAAAAVPFAMLNEARETIGAALIYLGHSPNSTSEAELTAAADLLRAQRARVLTYAPFASARDMLASGDVTVAHNYSGDVLMAKAENSAIEFVIPREGSIIWTDNMAVLKEAPHPNAARVLVNYLLDAEIGARLSNFTRYATPNAAAEPFIDADLRNDRAVYPDAAVLERLHFLRDLGPHRARYDRIWTEIRAGK